MPRKSRKNVGLIGLGIIGTRVAGVLRSAGFHVFVWSRTPKAVPNFLGSPAEIAEICDVIQIFVSDAQAVIDTIESISDVLTSNHVVINCATIGPEATLEAAKLVQQKGAAFLDAPFTGSKIAAEKGQLCYYIGGDEAAFQRVKSILEVTSRAIVKCGKVGDAATLKVATNLITAVTTQTLAEALAIVRKSGIAPEVFAAAIEQNACKSGVIELKLPKMVRGDFDPHFSLKHMFKDVQLGIHIANNFDLEVPVTTVTAGVMYGALNNGWADLDFSSVFRIYADTQAEEKMAALPEQGLQQIEDHKETPDVPFPRSGDSKVGGSTVVEAELVESTNNPPAPAPAPPPLPEAAPAAKEKAADSEPEEIPSVLIGDIFKRKAPAPDTALEGTGAQSIDSAGTASDEKKAESAGNLTAEPEPDIPEVIFGRAVPSRKTDQASVETKPNEEAKQSDVKDETEAKDVKDVEMADLEKTVVPMPTDAVSESEKPEEPAAKTEGDQNGTAKEGSNGAENKQEEKQEEKPNAGEPSRFRPLQRIRRFFSPAGK